MLSLQSKNKTNFLYYPYPSEKDKNPLAKRWKSSKFTPYHILKDRLIAFLMQRY